MNIEFYMAFYYSPYEMPCIGSMSFWLTRKVDRSSRDLRATGSWILGSGEAMVNVGLGAVSLAPGLQLLGGCLCRYTNTAAQTNPQTKLWNQGSCIVTSPIRSMPDKEVDDLPACQL